MLELNNSCIKIMKALKKWDMDSSHHELNKRTKLGISETLEAIEHLEKLKYISSFDVVTDSGFPERYFLTQHGKSYLVFLAKQSTQKIQYWITTGIAVAALATSIAAIILNLN